MCHKCQLLDTYKHREGCPAKTGVNFYQQIQRKKPGISFHNRSWKKNFSENRESDENSSYYFFNLRRLCIWTAPESLALADTLGIFYT